MIIGPFNEVEWITMLFLRQSINKLLTRNNADDKVVIRHEQKKLKEYYNREAA